MSATHAVPGARHSLVVAAIIVLHVGVFFLIAGGLVPRAFVDHAQKPPPVTLLQPKEKPFEVVKPSGDPLDVPYSVPVEEPIVPIPNFTETVSPPVPSDRTQHDSTGEAPTIPTAGEVVPPRLRTRDQRLAALIDACYPPVSRRFGEEGRVIASITIGADGRVRNWHTIQSSGYAHLDEAVACIIERLAFVPGRRDGRAVEAEAALPILFRLN